MCSTPTTDQPAEVHCSCAALPNLAHPRRSPRWACDCQNLRRRAAGGKSAGGRLYEPRLGVQALRTQGRLALVTAGTRQLTSQAHQGNAASAAG